MPNHLNLASCPFCGREPPEDLSDTIYPSGTVWQDSAEGFRHYSSRFNNPTWNHCYTMNCTTNEGGCGASIDGDSIEETVAAWNRRANPDIVCKIGSGD